MACHDSVNLIGSGFNFLKAITMFNSGLESQEKLVTDIKGVISDAEEMLSVTADQAGEKIASLRARVQIRLSDAKERLAEAEAVLRDKTRAAAQATDDYVHESPWTAIGIAAGVGVLAGLMVSRR